MKEYLNSPAAKTAFIKLPQQVTARRMLYEEKKLNRHAFAKQPMQAINVKQ